MSRARRIEEEAADWLIRREEDAQATEREFEAWLAADVGHRAAFWRLEQAWRSADRLAAVRVAPPPYAVAPRRPGIRLAAWAASIVMLLGVVAAVYHSVTWREPATPVLVSTETGQRNRVALADGSVVTLNTASALRASVSATARNVWLDDGEAFFEIRHNPDLPFVVTVGERRVTVLGTKFSVRRQGGTVTVAVLEGRVRFEDRAKPAGEIAGIISAGKVAVADGRSMMITDSSVQKVRNSLTWRTGTLTFDQTPLADAAEEFNRYNARKITIVGEAARQMRIGGSFQASNVDAFARLADQALGLDVRSTSDGVSIASPHDETKK